MFRHFEVERFAAGPKRYVVPEKIKSGADAPKRDLEIATAQAATL